MKKIKYDKELMDIISIFETITQTRLKDCFINEGRVTFVVEQNQIGKAIGKRGMNVRRLEDLLKKRIRIIEFNSDLKEFVRNIIYPIKVDEIKEENNEIIIVGPDMKTRGLLIGRDRHNLIQTKSIVDRYFKVQTIKVV